MEVEYLSEDEYDALNDEDKAVYDAKVSHLARICTACFLF